MQGDGSGSSRRRQNGRKLCLCGLEAAITQAWTDKNPGRRFYGCQRFKEKNGCKFFAWFDEEGGTLWKKRALIEAWDEIREKSRVITHVLAVMVKRFGSYVTLWLKLTYTLVETVQEDGLHFRQPWAFGVQQEVERLREDVKELAEEIAKLKRLITSTSRP
ncbi:hypothetical protein HID58_086746 [Brassica napus]|uniref:GRF-type domain-containing protein n=1 Tax=Brassica napus TaxID=3708 RepID=A0ABQ7XR82_BRANA|nr:hypothetical protein HID58_086746 [Brassica napus]